jgi:hypothetical protein
MAECFDPDVFRLQCSCKVLVVMMTSLERDVGALDARMLTVEHEVKAMRKDVREIRDALVTARGGWKTLTVVIGISVSVGAMLAKLLPLIGASRF